MFYRYIYVWVFLIIFIGAGLSIRYDRTSPNSSRNRDIRCHNEVSLQCSNEQLLPSDCLALMCLKCKKYCPR